MKLLTAKETELAEAIERLEAEGEVLKNWLPPLRLKAQFRIKSLLGKFT